MENIKNQTSGHIWGVREGDRTKDWLTRDLSFTVMLELFKKSESNMVKW